MFLIDSHCHLNQLNYKNVHKNVSDVLEKARKKGVQLILSVSIDLSDYKDMIRNIGYRDNVFFSCGIHPLNLKNFETFNQDILLNLASNKHVIAIGETGLDYHLKINQKSTQKLAFKKHIQIAKILNKPLIVHSRNAIEDVISILIQEKAERCGGILHCFSENIESVRALLNINFYISFSGMITFRNSHIMRKIIEYTPIDRILLETDAPYLTPIPYRGQENQPAYVYEIAEYIAKIKHITVEDLASITTSNFYKLFQKSL